MNCSQAQAHLPIFADGELTGDLRAAVERHIAGCPGCGAEVARWRALRKSVQRVVAVGCASAVLRQRVLAQSRQRRRRVRLWIGAGGGGLLATAAVLLLVFLLFPRETVASVSPDGFGAIYRRCALGGHDQCNVCNKRPAACLTSLCQQAKFAVSLPDLTRKGYRLDGACLCSPQPKLRLVHAYYRKIDDVDDVVSVFVLASGLDLLNHTSCSMGGCGSHSYQRAQDSDLILIARSDDKKHGAFVFCAPKTERELMELAEGFRLVRVEVPLPDVLAATP